MATVNSTGLVTGISSPGVATITYSLATTPAGCAGSAALEVIVYPVPVVAAITGAATVCAGDTLQLNNASPGGAWSVTNTAVASISAAGKLTGLAGGITVAHYKVVSANGLCADSASKSITVNARSVTNLAGQLCQVSSYTFNGQTLTIAGIYTVRLTNIKGCDSIVTLNLTNATPDTTVVSTGSVLTTAPVAGATYQWLKCEPNGTKTPQAGETAQSLTPGMSGQFAVAITVSSCTAVSGCHMVTPVTIGTIVAQNVAIFPNPTKGIVTISAGDFRIQSIRVSDITGRILRVLNLPPAATTITVDLSDFPAGLYQLRLVSDRAGTLTAPVTVISR